MDKVLSVLRPLAPVTSVTDSEPECEPGEQLRQRRGGSRGGQTRGRGRNAGEYQRNGRGRGRGRSGTLNATAALCDAIGDEATADPEDAEALPKARSTGSSSSKKTQLKVAEAEGKTSDQKAPMKKPVDEENKCLIYKLATPCAGKLPSICGPRGASKAASARPKTSTSCSA